MIDLKQLNELKAKAEAKQKAEQTMEKEPTNIVEEAIQETVKEIVLEQPKRKRRTRAEMLVAQQQNTIQQPIIEETNVMEQIEVIEKPTPVREPRPTIVQPIKQITPLFANLKKVIKEVQKQAKESQNFESLDEGIYTGIVEDVELTKSRANKSMLKITMAIDSFNGLASTGKAVRYMLLEHDNETVVRITMTQIQNMLLNVGVIIDDATDLEALFTNLKEYFTGYPITFEVKGGFINFKDFNNNRV